MTLYERFGETKEAGFRDEFIKPLLIRLGFIGITNLHGSQEFGKDFVFSELDRFGHMRHMVVQAKHEKTINQGKRIDGLLSQTRQAFSVPFTLPSSPNETRYVSAVYVFNTGGITEGAITQIRHGLAKELAANTHFFSGEQIEAFSGISLSAQDRHARDRVTALIRQLTMNIHIWQETMNDVTQQPPSLNLRGGIIHGVETYITLPVFQNTEIDSLADIVWQNTMHIKGLLARLAAAALTDEQRQRDLGLVADVCAHAILTANELVGKLNAALAAMQPVTFD